MKSLKLNYRIKNIKIRMGGKRMGKYRTFKISAGWYKLERKRSEQFTSCDVRGKSQNPKHIHVVCCCRDVVVQYGCLLTSAFFFLTLTNPIAIINLLNKGALGLRKGGHTLNENIHAYFIQAKISIFYSISCQQIHLNLTPWDFNFGSKPRTCCPL